MPELVTALFAIAASLSQSIACSVSILSGDHPPQALEQHASVIVVGTARPCAEAAVSCFVVDAERVVKGAASLAGSSLTVTIPGDPCIPTPRTGHGIWFLTEDKDRQSVFVQSDRAMIEAPAGPISSAYAYPDTADVNDRLAAEMSAAVEAFAGRTAHGFFDMEMNDLRNGTIDDLKSPVTKTLWTRMAQSPSGPERLLGLAGLIRGGSIDAVVSAAKEAESLAQNRNEYYVLLRSIVDHFHPADDAAVVTLGQIATDANEYMEIRQATGHALAASGSPAAVQFLKMMANESDKTLRLESAVGLNDGTAMRRALESH